MNYYPIYLDLRNRRCVLVGGGPIAGGKARGLLDAGAHVIVIAPDLTPALTVFVQAERLTHHARRYRTGDLAGAFLAISATDDRAVNDAVWREANERGIPINVVDDPPHCTFIAPSILRRGDLTVAVSTGGKAPALAVRLREQFETLLGDEHARFLDLAGTLREPLAARYPDFETRKALWYRLVDSDVLDLLKRGDDAGAAQRITEIMGVVPQTT
ncbi:MAG TPA: bifunctional precorrin-2 dehydrogenase/sirohydrochlorin ferrochelatase [Anaerolineales bacterium]|nr:bifunctional precorrin-2 dehydrogenase/sirohydrochlorin ferrochelatase [Anaerolineales bacterium]